MEITKYKKPFPSGNKRPVIVDGVRTPFVKSFGAFEDTDALELFRRSVDGLIRRLDMDAQELDEISCGVVIPQTSHPNVARDAILSLGLPKHIHGYTLNRACTSSLQTIADAARTIAYGQPQLTLAGGVECLSDVPITYSHEAQKFLLKLSQAKSPSAKLSVLTEFSAKAWVPRPPGLAEPMTGLTMGEHGEIMAKKNGISREDQDAFALNSHQKAAAAQEKGFFDDELIPVWPHPQYKNCIDKDNIIRKDSSPEKMAGLKPAFDKKYGTLSAGNSSPLTDGAAVTLVADEQRAKDLGLKPKAFIRDMIFVGIDPKDQLLIGPAIAIPQILKRQNLTLSDIDRFEIHEAFAAQVLSCTRALNDKKFCEAYFGSSKVIGEVPDDKLNVNGGAIAIGHPFGATGSRLVNTLSNELIRSDKQLGLIAICAAGGMAGAMLIERI